MSFLSYDSNGKSKSDAIVTQQGITYMIPSGSLKLVASEYFSQSHAPTGNTGSITITSISAFDNFSIRSFRYTSSFIATPIPSNYVTSSVIGPNGESIPSNYHSLTGSTYLGKHPKDIPSQHTYFFVTGSTLASSITNLGAAIIRSQNNISVTTSSTAIFLSSSLENFQTSSLAPHTFVSGSTIYNLGGEKPVSHSIEYRELGDSDGEATPLESASVIFQHDTTDIPGKNSFMITGSGIAKIYFSSSGKFGIGTTTPKNEVDIKADSFKVRSKDGLREMEFDTGGFFKTKAYGAASSTGSELIMVYTSGSFGEERLPAVGSRLGQIRWTVESGSLAGRQVASNNKRIEQRGGTAAKIFSDVLEADENGVVGNIVFALPGATEEPPTERLRIEASGLYITGSMNISGVVTSLGTVQAEHIKSTDDIEIANDIFHTGDTDTKISFTTEKIESTADIISFVGDVTASNHISASGNIYSNNEEAISWTFQSDQTSVNWFGPNRQGPTYYYWNKDFGNDTAVQTLDWSSAPDERFLNSGWRVPYKMEITKIHFYGHNAQNAASGYSLTTTASLLVGSPEDGAQGNSSIALTVLGTIISNVGESRYAAMTASVAINSIVSESQFLYPRLKATNTNQDVNGTYTIYYKRIQ